jgi:hypothetical protein
MTDARDEPIPPSSPSVPSPSTSAPGTPAETRSPRVRRQPKFALPDHHHEEEAGDRIEAFLEGPPTRRRRSRSHRYHRRRSIAFATDQEWSSTLRYEAARSARYGRALAVLVVELTTGAATADAATADAATAGAETTAAAAPGPDLLALRLAEVLGREVRETDRAVRERPDRFLVLLPETGEDEAAHLASRIERGYRGHGEDALAGGDIHIEIAVPRRGTDPAEAIELAARRLEDEAAVAG